VGGKFLIKDFLKGDANESQDALIIGMTLQTLLLLVR
jgi:hypothetical protein